LFKVTNLFRARNFNIDSISVGITENPEFSRMTITTYGDEKQIQQIVKQLDKMIDTIEVKRLDEHKTVYREVVLFKIKVSKAADSMEINKLANAYGAKVHDAKKESIMVELTATPDQISAFEELVKPFGILEIARTGIAALQRTGA
ncbi:MAG: acetolactate synthase small subunit, partial [Thermoproteota archaeon]